MKLRNKKTGETGYYLHTHRDHKTGVLKMAVLKDGVPFSEFKSYEPIYDYDSLAELNRDWEDIPEEPKVGYIIDPMDGLYVSMDDEGFEDNDVERAKELGLWFETEVEAEKAVEKLKAWKRLKDKGFRFNGWLGYTDVVEIRLDNCNSATDAAEDLDLLFGGEE